MNELNSIPAMTDPLSRYWEQPTDIRQAPMDDTHILLSRKQAAGLKDYSHSIPSGVYHGKCWKRQVKEGYCLCWYGPDADPGYSSINYRVILEVEQL